MSNERTCIYALDLDQTMLDNDMFFDETERIARIEGITGGDDLHATRKAVEASGGSFDTFGFLQKQGASTEELDTLAGTLGENTKGIDYLYPDTQPFIDALDKLKIPHLTVTYGSVLTQLPKLRATGLDQRPYLITAVKQKGELAQTWRTERGYTVAAAAGQIITAETGVLVDDKAKSFDGLPADWTGFLVQRKAPKASQLGSVPEQVKTVPNLAAITHQLLSAV